MKDLILDVDDALALLFAVRHPDLRLRAVSCVAGNAGLDQVVANTLKVLDAAGAPDVPVGAGDGVRPSPPWNCSGTPCSARPSPSCWSGWRR
ncbi:nucleoside hydrolase [Nonomuraea insulae]|uniref:Nucleoside hydrolase n=1 Tax=Nonomuraea insulae TaxID=1616787 RepID=A0ABW1CPN1_9ACTN